MSGFNMAAQLRRQLQTVDPAAPRTIETVTQEIVDLKRKTGEGIVAIGQRLLEAKELLPHGEWLPWLEQKVDFSERTAQKFMALAKGYAENPQLAADLGSEKAFALLALPGEERQQIVTEGVTVDGKTKAAADLTTREVKQIVAERRDPAPKKRQPERTVDSGIWKPLLRGCWPEEGALVLLSGENFMGGYTYQLARCVGEWDDRYPFIDPNEGLTCEEFEDFDFWLPLVERRGTE